MERKAQAELASTWVWASSRASVAAGVPSVLAGTETFLATIAYLALALRYGPLHITLAAVTAPLLLIKTSESTQLALTWWRSYIRSIFPESDEPPSAITILLL